MARALVGPEYSRQRATGWLAWLARGLLEHEESVFLIENLQPSWLGSERSRGRYAILSRVAGSILLTLWLVWPIWMGVLVWIVFWRDPGITGWNLMALLLVGLLWPMVLAVPAAFVGTIVGLRARRGLGRSPDTSRARTVRGLAVAWVVLGGISVIVTRDLTAFVWFPLSLAAYSLVVAWPLMLPWLGRGKRSARDDIRPTESLVWSWPAFRAGARKAYKGWGLVITLVGALFSYGIFLIASPLCYGFLAALEPVAVETKSRPNEGIRLTVRSALKVVWVSALMGLALGIPIGVAAWGLAAVVFGDPGTLVIAPVIALTCAGLGGLGFGPFFAMKRGGTDVVSHYILRLQLLRAGHMPARQDRFLDYACDELGFLQRVGGGYMFIHRYLLEHFAEMNLEGSKTAETAGGPGGVGRERARLT